MEQKSFQELNLNNGFLFSAALADEEICQLVLECILGYPVSGIRVRTEHSVLYSTDFKYIRLDVLGRDAMEVSYDLEMQNKDEKNLPKRSRYYQAELDLASLKSGEGYEKLQPLFIIFICSFDPFGRKRYRYTFEMQCIEECFPLNDEVKRIFLSTKGKNGEEVSSVLVEFLGYLTNSTDAYVEMVKDERVKELHRKVQELKKNHDLEARYMRFEELLQRRENAGRELGLKEGRELGLEEGRIREQVFGELSQAMVLAGEAEQIPRLYQDESFFQSQMKQHNIIIKSNNK